jgi:protein phosphatase 1 regulatory subunit 7
MADAPEETPRVDPAIEAATDTPDAEKKDIPRDSKGWDGKLRVDKNVLVQGRDQDAAESDPEVSEDEGPPPEQLPADEDLLEDYPEDEDEIELVHLRISNMAALRLERFKKLKVRTFFLHTPYGIPRIYIAAMIFAGISSNTD